jgi:Uroporphyrinogen decarboxylase (URO-D)
MNSRKRFQETMRYGSPDRVPWFEEGIRKGVLKAWRKQDKQLFRDLSRASPPDRREEIELDLEPRLGFKSRPTTLDDLDIMERSLDPFQRGRLPRNWSKSLRVRQERDYVLMLRVHRGFFLSMGVGDWYSFKRVMSSLIRDPEFVRESMKIQGDFAARFVERVLQDIEIDAAVFSEPIGDNGGPLISPVMYEEFVLKNYQPLLDVLSRYGVETIILRTFANVRLLIPSLLKWGFNCLWACEVNIGAMDYRDLRREFGRDLRLIGGIDLDALRKDKETIRWEMERKVQPLVADGGYVPLADGRVREDVPLENYLYYRQLLEKITQG